MSCENYKQTTVWSKNSSDAGSDREPNNHVTGGLITTTTTTIGSGAGQATVLTKLPDNTQVKDSYSHDLLQTESQLAKDGTTVVTSQTFGYDALNRNTSSVDPVFGTTSQTLRLDGSVSGQTMPGHNAATVTTADATTEIPTAGTRSDGGSQSQVVNSRGQITQQSGAGLITTKFGYDDATGQLNDLKLYPSGSTSNTTGMQETKWGYDPATGAPTTETFADSKAINPDILTTTYNGVQPLALSGQGVVTTLSYNTAGERVGSVSSDGSQNVFTTVNKQDDQGNPTEISDATITTAGQVVSHATDTLVYSNGNLAAENQLGVGASVHYDYYPATGGGTGPSPNAIKDMVLIKNGTTVSTTAYQYDSISGRLQTMWVNNSPGTDPNATLFDGTPFGIEYKDGTNLVSDIHSGGAKTTWNYYTTGQADGNLSSVTAQNTVDNTSDYSAAYTYNNNDQRLTENISQQNFDSTTNSHSFTYGYDAQDQLKTVTDNNTGDVPYAYNYDGVGNQTGTAMGAANDMNEYSNDTYNRRGDETDDGTESFTWNAADQMTAVTAHDHSFKDTFQYDGQNRLIEKDVFSWDATNSIWSLSSVRRVVYDGKNIVAELDGNDHTVDTYAWGPNGLLAVTDFTGTNPQVYLAATDANGNLVQLDDATTGTVDASFTYAPYGKLLSATGPAANKTDILSDGGGFYVRGANIAYNQNRFVSTTEGHWLSEDPAGIAGGSNVFVYCGNDPINFSDPSGTTPLPGETAQSCLRCHAPPKPPTIDWNAFTGIHQPTMLAEDPVGIYQYGTSPKVYVSYKPDTAPAIEPPRYYSTLDILGLPGIGGDYAYESMDNRTRTAVNFAYNLPTLGMIEGSVNGKTDYTAERDDGASIPRALWDSTFKNTPVVSVGWRIGEATAGHRVGGLNDGQKMTQMEQLMPFGEFILLDASGRLSFGKGMNVGVVKTRGAVPAEFEFGRAYEAQRLTDLSASKNTFVWRPSESDIDSSAFKVIVGKPRYTAGRIPRGTILDATEGGFLEIKGGSSMLNSNYQLRLQTFCSLKENVPFTIDTTRPINPQFKAWLDRWGVNVKRPSDPK